MIIQATAFRQANLKKKKGERKEMKNYRGNSI